jgi:hypothetical protein
MRRARRFLVQLNIVIAPAETSAFPKTDEELVGASKKIAEVMHEFKHGTLRSGRSKKRVTNPKQAIAIGLSEARQAGARVPPESVSSGGRRSA